MERTNIDRDYVIDLFQLYKTALIKELGNCRNVHLTWLRDDKKIDFKIAEDCHHFYRDTNEDQVLSEISKINHVIEPVEKQMAGLTVQYAGGMVVKLVEEWLSWLESKEAEVLFWCYINHDYRKKHGRFQGLNFAEIAKKMNVDRVTVWRKEKSGIETILDKV